MQYPRRLVSGEIRDARARSPTLEPAGAPAPRARSADCHPSGAASHPSRFPSRSMEAHPDTSQAPHDGERRPSTSPRVGPYADPVQAARYQQVLDEEMRAHARAEIRAREGRPHTQPY